MPLVEAQNCSRKTKKIQQRTIFNVAAVLHLELRGLIMGSFKSPCRNAQNQIRAHRTQGSFLVIFGTFVRIVRLVHQLHFCTLRIGSVFLHQASFLMSFSTFVALVDLHLTFGTPVGRVFLRKC